MTEQGSVTLQLHMRARAFRPARQHAIQLHAISQIQLFYRQIRKTIIGSK